VVLLCLLGSEGEGLRWWFDDPGDRMGDEAVVVEGGCKLFGGKGIGTADAKNDDTLGAIVESVFVCGCLGGGSVATGLGCEVWSLLFPELFIKFAICISIASRS
jgi:hypothetical protein